MTDLEYKVAKLEKVFNSIRAAAKKNASAMKAREKSIDPNNQVAINAHNIKVMGDYIIAIDSALSEYEN